MFGVSVNCRITLDRGGASEYPKQKVHLGILVVLLGFKTIDHVCVRTISSLHRSFYSFYSAVLVSLVAINVTNRCSRQPALLPPHMK